MQYQEKALYREEFTYDGLNRVKEGRFARVGTTGYVGAARPFSLSNTYDVLGNICNKLIDGVNQNYSYAGRAGCGLNGSNGTVNGDLISSPHQVQSANGYTYGYDAHGNQTVASHSITSKSRSILYSVDDRAYEMTKGTDVTRFWYGMGGDRYKRVDVSIIGTKTTINVANLEIETLNGVTTTKRTVAGVLLEETKNNITTNKYLHHDQLGSVARITDDAHGCASVAGAGCAGATTNGNTLESMDYAAFGERRNVIDPRLPFNNGGQVSNGTVTLPNNQILTLYATKRGFTGHEMVDGFDIVHMNGRIYDNMIGRFLQADPVVQDPSNTQNFNRYTYVWNNPLAYTDPSGYMSTLQILKLVVAIVISIYLPGCTALFGSLTGGLFASVASGFLAGVATTGSLKGGLIGAFSAGMFYGIGSGFEEAARVSARETLSFGFHAAKVLAHGIAGGIMSVLQGDKFGHGFASAGFTEATAGGIAKIPSKLAQGVVATIEGGAVSALTGGKFANGAMSSLFSYAFNTLRHGGLGSTPDEPEVVSNGTRRYYDSITDSRGFVESKWVDAGEAKVDELKIDGSGRLAAALAKKIGKIFEYIEFDVLERTQSQIEYFHVRIWEVDTKYFSSESTPWIRNITVDVGAPRSVGTAWVAMPYSRTRTITSFVPRACILSCEFYPNPK